MDVEIKFEPEGRHGVVATGTYLFDAAKRLGVDIDAECGRRGECDSCKVTVLSGRNLLSEPTKAELDRLDAEQIIKGERLSCQAKIIGSGEITVMAKKKEKTEEEKTQEQEKKKVDEFRKEFDELPLEKKIAALLELEAVALSETISFVVNSPFKVVDKLMDVLAEFGLKMDREDQSKKRPEEHRTEENGSQPAKEKSEEKSTNEEQSSEKKSSEETNSGQEKEQDKEQQ